MRAVAARWRRVATLHAFLLVVGSTSGCTSSIGEADLVETSGAVDALAVQYGDDVSDFQRSVAARVASGEFVTFADLQFAISENMECVVDAGYAVEGPFTGTLQGQTLLTFEVIAPPDMTDPDTGAAPVVEAVLDDCSRRYSAYVQAVWAAQGDPVEWQDAVFDKYRARILDCLANYGSPVAPDSDRAEVESAMVALRASVEGDNGPDCAEESGANSEYRIVWD